MSSRCYFAGVLPVALWNRRVWCLLATELDDTLSSFGGGPENGESTLEAAIREAWEESGGAMLRSDLERAIEASGLALRAPGSGAVQYVIRVKDSRLRERIQSTLDLCSSCKLAEIRGCCEKKHCEWVRLSDILYSPELRQRLRRPFRATMDQLGDPKEVESEIKAAILASRFGI